MGSHGDMSPGGACGHTHGREGESSIKDKGPCLPAGWHLSYPLNFVVRKGKWGEMRGERGAKWEKQGKIGDNGGKLVKEGGENI